MADTQRPSQKRRTDIERTVDRIDCELYRLVGRIERLYDEHKRDHNTRAAIHKALMSIRAARTELFSLMHEHDREITI